MATNTTQDLSELSDEELSSLAGMIDAEIAARKQSRDRLISFTLETEAWFDARKHGHAYVAVLAKDDKGKIAREFLEGDSRLWDTKKKTYKRTWSIEARIGSVLECRLTDGSWKNDYRQWFVVTEDGPEDVGQTRAMELAKGE